MMNYLKYIFVFMSTWCSAEAMQKFKIGSSCNPTQNNLYASKVTGYVDAINDLRNMIASGQTGNHKRKQISASNMNYLSWSDGLAKGAQNCASKCPIHNGKCSEKNFGYVIYHRHISHNSDPRKIFQNLLEKVKWSKQLVWARATKFGCGRTVNKPLFSTPIEHVVCFFDEKPRMGIEPYVPGPIGGACKSGRSSGYSALCATSYNIGDQNLNIYNQYQNKK